MAVSFKVGVLSKPIGFCDWYITLDNELMLSPINNKRGQKSAFLDRPCDDPSDHDPFFNNLNSFTTFTIILKLDGMVGGSGGLVAWGKNFEIIYLNN